MSNCGLPDGVVHPHVDRCYQAGLEEGRRTAAAERDLLAKAMWEARVWLGFDPDGDDRFHTTEWDLVAANHVREAKAVRDDMEGEQEELEDALTRLANIEAQLVRRGITLDGDPS